MLLQQVNLLGEKSLGPAKTGPFLYPHLDYMHQHTCWIELNKKQFFSNVFWLKKLIGPDVGIIAVLKSNAYGHGLIEIGSFCQEHGAIACLSVFLLSDAIRLREIGITKPILILGGYDRPIDEGIKYGLDLVVYDWQVAQEICSRASIIKKMVRVQIKVDTGLTRLGFLPEEVLAVVQYVCKNRFVTIVGLYTHFAESDAEDPSFTYKQIAEMGLIAAQFKRHKLQIPHIHMANTGAALRFPEARGTMVRCGGALYGSYKDERFYQQTQKFVPGFSLQTCLQLKARVIAVREVPIGTPIGYARTFKTVKPMHLAVVAVGYYDGYDRRLSNKGKMLIRNQLASIVGLVGMNMTMIDVTNISHVTVGDEVTVIGDHVGLRLKDIAKLMNVIEYEVMPPLNPSLPRFIV